MTTLTLICIALIALTGIAVGTVFLVQRNRTTKRNTPSNSAGQKSASGKAGLRGMLPKDDRRLAYRYDAESVFVHDNKVWTGVRLSDNSDPYMSASDIDMLAHEASRGLSNLAGTNKPVATQYRITHQPLDVEQWRAQLDRAAWNPSQMYDEYSDLTAAYLRQRKATYAVAYLLIEIDTVDEDILSRLKNAAESAITGISDDVVPPNVAARWEKAARRVRRNVEALGQHGLTRWDRMWLINKTLRGHFAPNLDRQLTTQPWGPGQFELMVDFNADNNRDHLRIDVTNDDVDDPDRGIDSTALESYTTFLAVTDADQEIESGQNAAWLRWLGAQELEVSYRMDIIPAKKFGDILEKTRRNIADEVKNIVEDAGETPPQQIVDDQQRAEEAVVRAKSHGGKREPGLYGQIVVQVSAPTLDDLNTRVEQLTLAAHEDLNLTLARPKRYQLRLLETMLPGNPAHTVGRRAPFVRLTDVGHFGVGLPKVGAAIGDEVGTDGKGWIGNYIGTGLSGSPVFHSPHSATAQNSGGGVFIVGASGGGKSSLALLFFFQASESGVLTIVLDPKFDFGQFVYYMSFGPQVNDPNFQAEAAEGILGTEHSRFQPINRAFWDDTAIVNISAAPSGVLDAWQIRSDPDQAAALGEQLMQMFLSESEHARHSDAMTLAFDAVMERFRKRVNEKMHQLRDGRRLTMVEEERLRKTAAAQVERPTMFEVMSNLEQEAEDKKGKTDARHQQELDAIAAKMRNLRRAPYAHLAFAETPQKLFSGDTLHTKRRVVITLAGMELPSSGDQSTWTHANRMAAAIMYALVTVARELTMSGAKTINPRTGQSGQSRPTMLIVDESYMVSAVPAGVSLLQQTLAQGRSMGLITVLIDQIATRLAKIESGDSAADDPSGNQIEAGFGFQQRTLSDAGTVAPLLNDGNHAVISQALLPASSGIGQLSTGTCLYRDFRDRLDRLDVDLLYTELLRASDTNPKSRPDSQSYPISASPLDWEFLDTADAQEYAQRGEEWGREQDENMQPAEQEGQPAGQEGGRPVTPVSPIDTVDESDVDSAASPATPVNPDSALHAATSGPWRPDVSASTTADWPYNQ